MDEFKIAISQTQCHSSDDYTNNNSLCFNKALKCVLADPVSLIDEFRSLCHS